MNKTMRALVMTKPGVLDVKEVVVPTVEETDVLIRVDSVGICYTDVSIAMGMLPSKTVPITLGHELAGTIAAAGSAVSGFTPGDRVMARAAWPCGHCSFCRKGDPEHCEHREHLGITLNGAFAEYVRVPASVLGKLGEKTSFVDAQSSTTLAGIVRAMRRSGVGFGNTVAIVGAGHVGLIQLQVAKMAGAKVVDALDLLDYRLDLAVKLGARNTFNVCGDWKPAVREATGGLGYDLVIDAAGTPTSLATAVHCARKGGRVLVLGGSKTPVTDLVGWDIILKELTILAAYGLDDALPATLELLDVRAIQIEPMVSHHLTLDQAAEGIGIMHRREQNVLRVVIHP